MLDNLSNCFAHRRLTLTPAMSGCQAQALVEGLSGVFAGGSLQVYSCFAECHKLLGNIRLHNLVVLQTADGRPWL